MKRAIKAAASEVKLHVEFEPYERYAPTGIKRANITAPTVREALAKMADKMTLYIDSDAVLDESEYPTVDDIIEEIVYSNGDGCDYILQLKNVTENIDYIDEGQGPGEEW